MTGLLNLFSHALVRANLGKSLKSFVVKKKLREAFLECGRKSRELILAQVRSDEERSDDLRRCVPNITT